MRTSDVIRAWGKILTGRAPALSIEITRECPLRCPGCYAYEPGHLGGDVTLRDLADFRGDALVSNVLGVIDRWKPLHVSLVGGDPLVRYRELQRIVPALVERGIHVQIVSSAFRPFPAEWAGVDRLSLVVSVDGLPPEHDVRRAPATYARILKNIEGQHITVHCTITALMTNRPGYLEEFLRFWSARPEVRRVWFSLFTPQLGADMPEILTESDRAAVIRNLLELCRRFPKLDMTERVIRQFATPPAGPDDCIFAQTTKTISADLLSEITPCQFGGQPDCSRCGCYASMGLAAVGSHRLAGVFPVDAIFRASRRIGHRKASAKDRRQQSPLPVLD